MNLTRRTLLFLLLLLPALPAGAYRMETAEQFVLLSDQVLADETLLFVTGAKIDGTLKNDLFVFGQSVEISGRAEKDVWVAADSGKFTGTFEDNARILTRQTAEINGLFGGDLAAAGDTVVLKENCAVDGHTLLAGQNVIVEGRIAGKLTIIAARVTIQGKIGGDVRIISYTDDINILPGTEIAGNLVYTTKKKELFLTNQVDLKGRLIRKSLGATEAPTFTQSIRQTVSFQTYLFLAALLVGIPLVGLFPLYTGKAVRLVRHAFWKCILVGIMVFCLMPMLSALAMATIIGIPLGILLILSYAIMMYLCKFIVALAIGGMLLRCQGPQSFGRVLSAMAFGLLLLYLLGTVPVAGLSAWLLTVFAGLGSLVLALYQSPPVAMEPAVVAAPPIPSVSEGVPSGGRQALQTVDEPQHKER